jgi:hypothetical protein
MFFKIGKPSPSSLLPAMTELHVWAGLGQAFFYNINLPDSREAFDVMARFCARNYLNYGDALLDCT